MSSKKDRNSSTQTANNWEEGKDVQVPQPPKGGDRFKWLGPSFLWMLSAAGSGNYYLRQELPHYTATLYCGRCLLL